MHKHDEKHDQILNYQVKKKAAFILQVFMGDEFDFHNNKKPRHFSSHIKCLVTLLPYIIYIL